QQIRVLENVHAQDLAIMALSRSLNMFLLLFLSPKNDCCAQFEKKDNLYPSVCDNDYKDPHMIHNTSNNILPLALPVSEG
ncbi:hypothetical protein ACJX0J_018980, partial [Zea mays]